ncbi:MAG: histidine phosphatase family protein [Anaerofustis sp.]
MELYLIRHGERYRNLSEYYDTEKQTMNPPLTPKGILQAERLAKRCADIPFDAIYASDLTRAKHTAEIMNETVRTKLIITDAFREIRVGELNHKTWEDFPELYEQWNSHEEDTPYPDGENGSMVWERCKPVLADIIGQNPQRAAVVCHGGTIRVIICGLLGLPMQKRFFIGNPPLNCALTILQMQNGRWFLHTLNDAAHTADLS